MRSDRDERIKQRAYELWQSEGHDHGRHEDHWHRAEREIAAEERGPTAAPRRAGRSAKATTTAKAAAATPARSRSAGSETRGEKPAAPKKPATRSRKSTKKG